MDTMLVNGDHYINARGLPVKIFDEDEIIQQILLRLQVRKGSFALDTSFGSDLYKLPAVVSDANSRTALSYILNALGDIKQISNISAKLNLDNAGNLIIYMDISINNKEISLSISA